MTTNSTISQSISRFLQQGDGLLYLRMRRYTWTTRGVELSTGDPLRQASGNGVGADFVTVKGGPGAPGVRT